MPLRDLRTKRFLGAFPAVIRPDPDTLGPAILNRIEPAFIEAKLRQLMAHRPQDGGCPDNYGVFRLFPRGEIWNYNLDRYAESCCGHTHLVRTIHGSVSPWFGTDEGAAHVAIAQEFGPALLPGPELLMEPETLTTRLPLPSSLGGCEFVAVVGYTFGRNDTALDDARSFAHFGELLAKEPKPVVVIDPHPDFAAAMIEDRLRSKHVYAAPLFWDLTAKAILTSSQRAEIEQVERHYDCAGSRR